MTSFHHYVSQILKNESQIKICDLGCGPKKFPKSFGVDSFQFPEVDQIQDLDEDQWDIEDNRFDVVLAHQVFEHIQHPLTFFKNLHRIVQPQGLAILAVPHFTSANSYRDPTHKRHLSALWTNTITNENYLKGQVDGTFKEVNIELTFGRGFKDFLGRTFVKFYGLEKYERRAAFKYPASDIYSALRILK